MSTSAHPALRHYTPFTQLLAHSALKTSQAAGLLIAPLYLLSTFRPGRVFSIRGLVRASTRGVVIGAPVGALAAWGRLRNESEEALEDRCFRLIHVDDLSLIGASLGAVLTPALLLRRAPFPLLVSGGAAMGLGAGTAVHIAQLFTSGEKVKPEGMVGELPVVGGNK